MKKATISIKWGFFSYAIYMFMIAGISYVSYFGLLGFKESDMGKVFIFFALLSLCAGFWITRHGSFIASTTGLFFGIIMMTEMLVAGSDCIIGNQLLKLYFPVAAFITTRPAKSFENKHINKMLMSIITVTILYLIFSGSYLLLVEDGTQKALDRIAFLGYVSLMTLSILYFVLSYLIKGENSFVDKRCGRATLEQIDSGAQIGIPIALFFVIEPLVIPFLEMITANAAVTERNLQDCIHFANVVGNVIIIASIYAVFDRTVYSERNTFIRRDEFRQACVFILIYLCTDFLLQYTGSAIFYNYLDFGAASKLQTEGLLNGSINWQIFAVVITGPVVEELVFRFGIFGGMRKKFNFGVAASLSSLIFGVLHMNWTIGISAFFLGFICCVLYESTQQLFYPVLLHMASNLVSVIVTFFTDGEGIPRIEGLSINIAIFACTSIGGAILVYKYMKNRNIIQRVANKSA